MLDVDMIIGYCQGMKTNTNTNTLPLALVILAARAARSVADGFDGYVSYCRAVTQYGVTPTITAFAAVGLSVTTRGPAGMAQTFVCNDCGSRCSNIVSATPMTPSVTLQTAFRCDDCECDRSDYYHAQQHSY